MASTLTITIPTHSKERNAWMILPVAKRRMMKAKTVAIVIPLKAEDMKDLSVGSHAQRRPAVYSALFIP